MADTKKYYWLKLKRDFFKRHDIKIIESMENGKDYVLFYLKLLLESVDHDGTLRFSETVPYNDSMLATITDTNIDTVRSAVKVFSELGMMDRFDDGTLYMSQVESMLGSETSDAVRMRLAREKKKQLLVTHGESEQCSESFKNRSPELELELELEKDIEKDKRKRKNQKREKNLFVPPTLEDIKIYCQEKGYTINEKIFFDHYDSLEWKDKQGKPVQNWKNKVVNWAAKDYNQVKPLSKTIIKKQCPICGGEICNSTCVKCGIMLDAKGDVLE